MNDMMVKTAPLISIVTPSFNQAAFIGAALKSVKEQGYQNYEHLIIDGLSTDGTVEILQHLQIDAGSKVKWISEADSGQSAALNKGFRLAKGEIIGWLNSDDSYKAGCFERIIRAFEHNPDIDVIYGDYDLIDEFGNTIRRRCEIEFSRFILRFHRILYIPTTAAFFRRSVLDDKNWLNENLHYAMDLDLFVRLMNKGYLFKHLNVVLGDYRLQPESKTCSSPEMFRVEHLDVIRSSISEDPAIKSAWFTNLAIALGTLIASSIRYLEKSLRAYYWK